MANRQYEYPVALTKADIKRTADMYGKANADEWQFPDGPCVHAGTCRYVVFAGARQKDGLYHGRHRFEISDKSYDDAIPRVSFAELFQTTSAPVAAPESESETNGI